MWPPAAGPLGHDSVPIGYDRSQSLASIAANRGMDPVKLLRHNFSTQNPAEVNWYLREYLGCFNTTADGRNYLFHGAGTRRDVGDPSKAKGNIFVPKPLSSLKAGPTVANYTLGPAARPVIPTDNGFLDTCTVHSPAWTDWVTRAAGGVGSTGYCAVKDLTEACAAYDHFLNGKGGKWTIAYQTYARQDASGGTTARNAVKEAQNAVESLVVSSLGGRVAPFTFEFTGTAIACQGKGTDFPYPATENWQKAIGAHHIWLSGKVDVSQGRDGWEFRLQLKIHAEDRYNFNPGAKDIKTGIGDAVNGRLECSGLGTQFDQSGELALTVSWPIGQPARGVTTGL